MKKLFPLLLLWGMAISTQAQVYAKKGMVVSDDKRASEAGVAVLQKGGNAIDAAVATALALAVTFPQAGNIGGGGFLMFMDKNAQVKSIDFREKAPLSAGPDLFLDPEGKLIENSNHKGMLSVGVPGTIAGLYTAHSKYGTLPWAQLVQPAIDLAANGVPLSFTLGQHAAYFDTADVPAFLKNLFRGENGEILKWGETWKQPALANTLKIIQEEGADGFYKGSIAKKMAKCIRKEGGIITRKDLESYRAIERIPVSGTFNGYTVYGMPPPSSGGVAIIEMLNLLEQLGIDTVAFNSTEYYHLLAESMRRAFADRAEHLGDPDFNPFMPLTKLTSKEFARQRAELVNRNQASESDSSKFGQLYDGANTTHFSVVDEEGNAVSVTYTLEFSYGSGLGCPELGFLFNNEMGDFNPQPGLTTSFGLIGTPPNQIAPGKRMLSSMSPTIVAKDGKPYLVVGSPGGRTIINTVFQTVLTVLQYDMSVQEAIEAPKIHHQWLPDVLIYERTKISPDTQKALEQMGHQLRPYEVLGRLMGIKIHQEQGYLEGGKDSSSPDGAAIGY